MPNLTILSCTNRPQSRSLAVANVYAAQSKEAWKSVSVHSLEALNGMTISDVMYDPDQQDEKIKSFYRNTMVPFQVSLNF